MLRIVVPVHETSNVRSVALMSAQDDETSYPRLTSTSLFSSPTRKRPVGSI
jgi:hypothetical protein